ncbi:MAG: 16S rRNA (adenine(1518)-N(6)/adenine(1519)-N(6))-dimethyltransferase RsmA [bacterium]|nr:16S rRNA (adenine(1518)-N(6)/adenine(1519)-N(6))-dimethyltransferase RsmA [bacterium]
MKLSAQKRIRRQTPKQTTFQPTRIRGQHFLSNKRVIEDVLDAAQVTKKDIVVEIGPGHGALTVPLTQRAQLVEAVEIDPQAIQGLHAHVAFSERVSDSMITNITITHADVMDLLRREPSWVPKQYLLVSNLPFKISSDVLRIFLTDPRIARPERMVLILQYELAKRITATPGEMSTLSVMVQATSRPEFLKKISRGSFTPPPGVDAALVRLTPKLHKGLTPKTLESFLGFVHAGFAARRRMLANTLVAAGYDRAQLHAALTRVGIPATIRPQDLSIDQWVSLFTILHA